MLKLYKTRSSVDSR